MEFIAYVQEVLASELVGLLLKSSSRTYWLFIVASCVVAAIMWRPEKLLTLTPRERLWSKETWASRSAINDYGLIMLNAGIMAAIIHFTWPDPKALTAMMQQGFAQFIPHAPSSMAIIAPILLALALFLVDDFIRFAVHYTEHRIPFLWQFHKVHHSATVLNFMTAERHHPVSIIFTSLSMLVGIVTVNGLFLALFGDHLTMTTILGGNIFWVVANLLGSAFRHSPVWISFGPTVERWLISPAQHQIHHSEDERHWDKNMGGTLAIWDRMFGTLYITSKERERITYGIGEETENHASLAGLYIRPFIDALRLIRPVKQTAKA